MYWKPFHKNPCKVRLNILWLCNVDYGLHKEENTLLLSYLMSVGFNVLTPVIFLIKQIPLVLAEFFVLNCPTEQYLGNAVILLSMANWNEPASSPFIRTPLKPQVLAAELWNTFPATIFFKCKLWKAKCLCPSHALYISWVITQECIPLSLRESFTAAY